MTRNVVISLARSPGRLNDFLSLNDNSTCFTIFDAVDGTQGNLSNIDLGPYFSPDILATYSKGAVGNAMSHIRLWERVANSDAGLNIFEDDAILRKDFKVASEKIIEELSGEADIILWGYNYDFPLYVNVGIAAPCVPMVFDQEKLRAKLSEFVLEGVKPVVLRVSYFAGVCGYFVTPQGARNIISAILPIKYSESNLPLLRKTARNIGVDMALSLVSARLKIYACIPSLVATPNLRSASTVQE